MTSISRLFQLAAAASLALAVSAPAGVATGAAAPDFSVTDSNGDLHTRDSLKGKYVVLEWCNFGCPFVKRHYDTGNMQAWQNKFTDAGVVWLTVSSSAPGKQGYLSPADWNRALQDKGMGSTAAILDEDGSLGRAFGAKTTPHLFVINPAGTVIYQGAIDSNPGRAEGADNYVALALEADMSGKPVATGTTRPYGCGVKY